MPNLIVEIDGEEFLAVMQIEKAPKTCAALRRIMPLKGKVIHARWSGEAVWLPMDGTEISVEFENQTMYPSKGEMLFYPGVISEKEILIPYGYSIFASKVGGLPGNHFATIENKPDLLRKMGERVLWEGAKSIVIRAQPD